MTPQLLIQTCRPNERDQVFILIRQLWMVQGRTTEVWEPILQTCLPTCWDPSLWACLQPAAHLAPPMTRSWPSFRRPVAGRLRNALLSSTFSMSASLRLLAQGMYLGHSWLRQNQLADQLGIMAATPITFHALSSSLIMKDSMLSSSEVAPARKLPLM